MTTTNGTDDVIATVFDAWGDAASIWMRHHAGGAVVFVAADAAMVFRTVEQLDAFAAGIAVARERLVRELSPSAPGRGGREGEDETA